MIVASTYTCDICGAGYSGADTARVYTTSAYCILDTKDLCTPCFVRVREALQLMREEHITNRSTDGTDRA